MKTTLPGPEPTDPAALMAAIGSGLERAFARQQAAPAGSADAAMLVLGLELRSKLEELLLLPALYDAGAIGRPEFNAVEARIEEIRQASDALADLATDAPAHAGALAALLDRSRRHAGEIDTLLGRARGRAGFDAPRLAGEMLAMISRWQEEISRTGDIEDEERDPVGLPPR